jgi:hypothetical protein
MSPVSAASWSAVSAVPWSAASAASWPWLTVAMLGLFHGLNPAMGWLFAVALGLHRRSRTVMLVALAPIALGHALAIALALAAGVTLLAYVDHATFARVCGAILIGWALWHGWRGHRMRARVGMQPGMLGLALWSFVAASAHGAGLMLIPVLMPICSSAGALRLPASGLPAVGLPASGAMTSAALAMLGLHTVAMLVTIAAISLVVYERVGLGFLRTGWINLDRVWIATLLTCGTVQLAIA